jgi:GT2 family glycosyltransferase
MSEYPKVIIIIVNWNGYQDTSDCLRSIAKIDYPNYSIVVIDNGSKGREAEKIKRAFKSISLIKNRTNKGYATANNQGIKFALSKKAEYLLLLNNDTLVKKDFLSLLVKYAEENGFKGILTPKILYYKSNHIWAMGGRLPMLTSIPRMTGQGKPSARYKKIIHCDYASGCALFVPSKTVRKIGLLNPIYFAYYEDTDFSFRAKSRGFDIRVIPESIIWHKVSRSTAPKNLKKIGRAQGYLLARNGLIFGRLNLQGLPKALYFLNQYLTKPFLYLLFKLEDSKAVYAYLRGLWDGTMFILGKKVKLPLNLFL